MPTVAAVKTMPVSIALYPRTVWRKTATTNDVPLVRLAKPSVCPKPAADASTRPVLVPSRRVPGDGGDVPHSWKAKVCAS